MGSVRAKLNLLVCLGMLTGLSVTSAALTQGNSSKLNEAPAGLCGQGKWPDGVHPAAWVDPSGITATGFGKVEFVAQDGKRLFAHVYRASAFDPARSPIWFVMHGVKRDARQYLNAAAPVAERHQALVIVIEFSARDYPTEEDYTLGVTTRGKADEKARPQGRWRKPTTYLYAEIERVFEAVRRSLGGAQSGYYLFGHSAGAQFSHRLVTFLPCARVLGVVAANAGWYTLPEGKSRFAVPYSLRGSPNEHADPRPLLAAPLTILLGTRDTMTPATDQNLRGTSEAMAQGPTRFARGKRYFETGKALAQSLGAAFGWRLALAPGAEHNVAHVIASAGFLLFSPNQSSCQSSPAAAAHELAITEVLADPPDGARGDANGDGTRDASADEFVEIVNAGATPICLSGWTLSDAGRRGGHLFPLSRPLRPGQAVVVFGGGVPTGQFGGSEVQSASYGQLSLSSTGDVLTLRDAQGAVAKRFSWGDCDGKACAKEHWRHSLNVGGSLGRSPRQVWRMHRDLAAADFSPGRQADGSKWREASDGN